MSHDELSKASAYLEFGGGASLFIVMSMTRAFKAPCTCEFNAISFVIKRGSNE